MFSIYYFFINKGIFWTLDVEKIMITYIVPFRVLQSFVRQINIQRKSYNQAESFMSGVYKLPSIF